ncbi:phosphatidylinositol-3,5-bisphosphate 3-phosphatase MTMR4 isoform X3 [Lycorma delicatula]|uniref:phosphatidylinositol-3,5-bisphosphate 3-phosphatase MTMR4 isoform X3 n=1 Tax=Lycorma delicatula TaxID=130591 RepID=UPI003F50EB59
MDDEYPNSIQSTSTQSLFHVRASELYPKRTLHKEHDFLTPSFVPLCGEAIEYLGQASEGVLALSNYRLYLQLNDKDIYYNIPLGLVDHVEVRDLVYLHITCKDARTCRCSFASSELCLDWLRRIVKAITPPKNKDEVFAFAYFAWAGEELGEEMSLRLGKDSYSSAEQTFQSEVERLKFDVQIGGVWRISSVNVDHKLCATYPRYLLTPASISDRILESAARFRTSRRVPAVVWRHRGNGAVIARCSQPEVGWLGWRSSEDEELLKAITDACTQSNPSDNKTEQKLLIMDARSYTTAVANRARGGGCECPEYYPNCEIKFMNLANIHSIRKSFNALQALCAMPPDQAGWYSTLESTKWLHNMSGLLHAAVTVVTAVEEQARPVLVHCSDGWDRTPQIISLAQLLLDPFYRTIEGFQVLVEREWLEFGHKFNDRCGLSEDVNERCPVFLQWLDCIHNLVRQFPCAFEFSNSYLVKLAQHTYSNLFGTFLCNSSAERFKLGLQQRTFSVWKFLQSPKFRNHLYSSSQDQVLWPACNVRYLDVWRELYLEHCNSESQLAVASSTSQQNIVEDCTNVGDMGAEDSVNISGLVETDDRRDSRSEDISISNNNRSGGTSSGDKDGAMIGFDLVDCGGVSDKINCDKKEKTEVKEPNSDRNVSAWMENGLVSFDSDVEDYSEGLSGHSSTDTIVPSSHSNGKEKLLLPSGTASDLLTVSSPSSSGHPVFPLLLDPVDGLAPLKDQIQTRLEQMALEHKAKELALERELRTTRLALLQQVCHQCSHSGGSVAAASTSGVERSQDDEQGSLCSTEVSWEAVEEPVPTLWVPDHAVSHCTGCHNQFWLGRRKHHCSLYNSRSCGKIFCADCSENVVALPEEQLYEPVRVCSSCYRNPFGNKSNPTTATTVSSCKQQGSGVGIVLPPTQI